MISFGDYPKGGTALLGKPEHLDNCRHGYCLELQRLTKQRRCAYCDVDLTHSYYTWLLLGVDHVIPQHQACELQIPEKWYKDFTNLVLCCSGCNGFGNRYQVQAEPHQWTCQEFYELRDRAYREKYVLIAQRREKEMAFFGGHPWEEPEEVPPA